MKPKLAIALLALMIGPLFSQATPRLDQGDVVVTTEEISSCLFVPGSVDAGTTNRFWTIAAQSRLEVMAVREEKEVWYKVSGDQWVEEKNIVGNYKVISRAVASGIKPLEVAIKRSSNEKIEETNGVLKDDTTFGETFAPNIDAILVTINPLTAYIHPNINTDVGNEVFTIPVGTIVRICSITKYQTNWYHLSVGLYSYLPRYIEEKELLGNLRPCPQELIDERNRVIAAQQARHRDYVAQEEGRQARQKAAQAVRDDPKGPKPNQSELTGKVRCITDYLEENLNDPDVDYVEWSPVISGGDYWRVRCKFRAKNGFGARILCNWGFRIQNGQVVDYVEW